MRLLVQLVSPTRGTRTVPLEIERESRGPLTEARVLSWLRDALACEDIEAKRLRRRARDEEEEEEQTRWYGDNDVIRIELRPRALGLLGGKGGFGAGLREMGKQAGRHVKRGEQQLTDFSMCRDLQGRRLGPVNDALLLQRLEALSRAQRGASSASSAAATSALPNSTHTWLLERPGWAEKSRIYVESGVTEKAGDAQENKKRKRNAVKQPRRRAAISQTGGNEEEQDDDEISSSMAASVALGLKKKKQKKERDRVEMDEVEDDDDEESPPDTNDHETTDEYNVLTGKATLVPVSEGTFLVRGDSAFATVCFPGWALEEGGIRCEAVTEGLAQVGFLTRVAHASNEANGDGGNVSEERMDGVGDVENSWGLDCARGMLWKSGREEDLSARISPPWKRGDVAVCYAKVGASSNLLLLTFEFNDAELTSVEVPITVPAASHRVIPAVSLEEGEVMLLSRAMPIPAMPRTAVVFSASASTHEPLSIDTNASTPPLTLETIEKMPPEEVKAELKSLGLKFGGAPKERAQRLFIARTLPRADWPASLFPS